MSRETDADGNGTIDIPESLSLVARIVKDIMIDYVDVDGNGVIHISEFLARLARRRMDITSSETDADGDGATMADHALQGEGPRFPFRNQFPGSLCAAAMQHGFVNADTHQGKHRMTFSFSRRYWAALPSIT